MAMQLGQSCTLEVFIWYHGSDIMKIVEITLILPSPLLEDIVENRCIPIIGAGFSRNATTPQGLQMPLWNDVAGYFSKQLEENYSYVNPLDPISDYCHKFGKAKVVEQLRTILYTGKINVSPAHLAFADLPFDTVITTNFDFLL
jgi:hypothetical protein